MIFLSAQPDQYYFLWQLQLQVFNFQNLGIRAEQIHVLIGYDPQKGLSKYFRDFIAEHPEVNVHAYEDTRINNAYLSSIRPHLIAKHFSRYPELENEAVFYHDSDMIFNQLPDFDQLLEGDCWYASDTRNYTDSNYIKQAAGPAIFEEMCSIIGVAPDLIVQHDTNCGGAQYVLKNVSAEFWTQLEVNSELIFSLLYTHNMKLGFCNPRKIQAWCADMWCLWWQGLQMGRNVAIHPELDFAWANTKTDLLNELNIIHYTGSDGAKNHQFFRKNDYCSCSPFNDDFLAIDRESSSYTLVQEIARYKKAQLKNRLNLRDVSFLIPVRIDSEDRLENVYMVCKYLYKNFDTNIILIEADQSPKIDQRLLPENLQYVFIEDHHPKFHRTRYNNQMMELATTSIVSLYDTDVILPVAQMEAAVELLRGRNFEMVFPYDGDFAGLDLLMKAMFSKLLDAELFTANSGKLLLGTRRSYGGCVFLDKKAYQKAGLENEYLTSWGPDDLERWKRMSILGYRIKRIPGALYHLPHPGSKNSGYNDKNDRIYLINEYLKVCSMQQSELKQYIKNWNWIKN